MTVAILLEKFTPMQGLELDVLLSKGAELDESVNSETDPRIHSCKFREDGLEL